MAQNEEQQAFQFAEHMIDNSISLMKQRNMSRDEIVQDFVHFITAHNNPGPEVLGCVIGLLFHRVVELELEKGVSSDGKA